MRVRAWYFYIFFSMTKGEYLLICRNSCYVSGIVSIIIIQELAVHFTRREIVRTSTWNFPSSCLLAFTWPKPGTYGSYLGTSFLSNLGARLRDLNYCTVTGSASYIGHSVRYRKTISEFAIFEVCCPVFSFFFFNIVKKTPLSHENSLCAKFALIISQEAINIFY